MKTFFYIFSTIVFLVFSGKVIAQTEFDQIEEETESGNYSAALQLTLQKLKSDSLNIDLWRDLGELYQLTQHYNQSIGAYEHALKLDTTSVKVLLALARTNKMAGKINAAIENYEKLLRFDSVNVGALSGVALLYTGYNKHKEAYEKYYRLYQLDTLNAGYIWRMAKSKISMDDMPEAFELLQKAYVVENSNLPVVYDLTKFYIDSRQNDMLDTAIAILDKSIEQFPQEAMLYLRRGDANYGKNHHYRSITDYEKTIELGYTSPHLIKHMATSYFSLKKYEKSKDLFESLIQRDTSDYQVCMYLGNIYNELGKADDGLNFLDKAIEIITPEPLVLSSIYHAMSVSYSKKGRYFNQIQMIKKRQEVLPNEYQSNMYFLEIAEIYENDLKDKQSALKYYNDYWLEIKGSNWYSEEKKNGLQAKINRLKEELHFEK